MKHYKHFCKTNGLKDCIFSSLQAYKLHLNMTQSEAKEKLHEGLKITHWLFSDNEFIFMDSGSLKGEDGNYLKWSEFWKYRQGENFKTGWKIWGA